MSLVKSLCKREESRALVSFPPWCSPDLRACLFEAPPLDQLHNNITSPTTTLLPVQVDRYDYNITVQFSPWICSQSWTFCSLFLEWGVLCWPSSSYHCPTPSLLEKKNAASIQGERMFENPVHKLLPRRKRNSPSPAAPSPNPMWQVQKAGGGMLRNQRNVTFCREGGIWIKYIN